MHYPDSKPTSLCSLSIMLHSREATNTNFMVFALTRLGVQPTIYYTRDGHANHYYRCCPIGDLCFMWGCSINMSYENVRRPVLSWHRDLAQRSPKQVKWATFTSWFQWNCHISATSYWNIVFFFFKVWMEMKVFIVDRDYWEKGVPLVHVFIGRKVSL